MKNKKELISKIHQVMQGEDPDHESKYWIRIHYPDGHVKDPEGYPEDVNQGDTIVNVTTKI